MKVPFYFKASAFLILYGFVPGTISNTGGVAPSADYPYIINEVSVENDSLQNLLQRISSLKDADINRLLQKHNSLTNSNHPDVANLLYTMLIQHSLSRIVLTSLRLDPGTNQLLKDAVKVQLQISKTRVLNVDRKGLDLTLPTTEKPNNQIEQILKSIVDSLKHRMPEMGLVDQLKYIIHTTTMEYISLSLVDTHISSFLSQLFGLLDKGKMVREFSYYEWMLKLQPPIESQSNPYVEGKDGTNLMLKYFQKITPFVDNFLNRAPRNKQQIHFQNQLLVNHCILRKSINQLPSREHRDVYIAALKLKLGNFEGKLGKNSENIFDYTVYDSRGLESSLGTMVDFENDPVFSGVAKSRSYKTIKGSEGPVRRVLEMWVSHNIVLAIIDDVDMYTAINQCFLYIERVEDSSHDRFCAKFVADGRSILEKMGCKGRFMPAFQLMNE